MVINWDRVYINLGPDYRPEHILNLDDLLLLYAESRQCRDNNQPLFDNLGNLFQRRTERCLVSDTNKFINDMDVFSADENMASYTSRRQIKFLKYALLNKKKRAKISGYSLILLHCIYVEIKNSPKNVDPQLLRMIAEDINQLIDTYYDSHSDDEIAHFLLECFDPLCKEIDQNTCFPKTSFPDIPKTNIREQPDE